MSEFRTWIVLNIVHAIDPFPKRHKLVHNDEFSKFKALYCSLNVVNSAETS